MLKLNLIYYLNQLFSNFVFKGNLIFMTTQNTFSVSFYLRADKIDKMNTAPVFMRVTINSERAEIATHRRVDIKRWDKGRLKGINKETQELNNYLASLKQNIFTIQRDMIDRKELITPEKIKNRFQGKDKNSKTLIETFVFHNLQIKGLIGKDFKSATVIRYETTLKHVQEFLKEHYKVDDIYLSELNYEFITSFEYYLKTIRKCGHNTALKYIGNFKKIINLAVKYDWLPRDPFINYKNRLKEVEREALTQEELNTIEQKSINIQRIEIVRDLFVFACYTGLAYAEVAKLTKDHIVKGMDGKNWIVIRRTKTDNKSMIPLLPKATGILEKYSHYPKLATKDELLPVNSNQKVNAYLKELADICGITKTLTFHLARHTFATTVTLTNGVSIESVSAMLGHKSIRTTQIYSKVVEKKVSNDMAALLDKLESDDRRMKVEKN